jgi:hypothetical protein
MKKFRFFVLILGLLSTELLAWWWMHPRENEKVAALLGWNTVLLGADKKDGITSQISWHPEMVDGYRDSLNCTTGAICKIQKKGDLTIHAALFTWDQSASVAAIEAFRHRPERCLGSIGMKMEKEFPSRLYVIDGETLHFNHTYFRDQKGVPVHAFKATWVAGLSQRFVSNMVNTKEWRELRVKAALSRFSPKHARVIQGAVRSIHSPDEAWTIFEDSVLQALHFE